MMPGVNKKRIAFIVLALAFIAFIVLRPHDAQHDVMAKSFGTAFVIVFSVFALLSIGIGIAWAVHKKKRDALYKSDDVR
jgi:hypothetical protein